MTKIPLSAREIALISSLIESASEVQAIAAICLREGRWAPPEPGIPILDSLADRVGMFAVVADALQQVWKERMIQGPGYSNRPRDLRLRSRTSLHEPGNDCAFEQ